FGIAALLLLPPTTLMGATLPLLARRVVRGGEDMGALGRRIGALYAANTAGAVVGTAAAGFWLIPAAGVNATNRLAVATDLALSGPGAAATWRRTAPPAPSSDAPVPEAPPATQRRIALAAFAVSGFVAMTLEVLWSRALALVIGSSVYSFTLVLIVF